jgi:transcription antitermination protein NusB
VTASRTAPRHRSREAALQALYAADIGGEPDLARAQASLESLAEHFELPAGARAFAKELVLGVATNRADIDARISAVAHRWRLERMAAVDRNVLRLAAYEIVFAGTPREVAIDEAVELARRFSDDASPRFVNGVLDALARAADAEPAR